MKKVTCKCGTVRKVTDDFDAGLKNAMLCDNCLIASQPRHKAEPQESKFIFQENEREAWEARNHA